MKMTLRLLTIAVVVLTAFAAQTSFAQGWGSVSGKIVFDGDIPKAEPLIARGKATKDPTVCAADGPIVDDSLVIDAESKGIANIFVYLRRVDEIHPDLEKSEEDKVVMDQKNCRFLPHAMVVRTDQKINVLSDDDCAHNVNFQPFVNQPFNQAMNGRDRVGLAINVTEAERLPAIVQCNIHPWMKAYWMILDHPYAVVTNEKGEFKIDKIPAGEHEFVLWHERAGYLSDLDENSRRGFKVTVTDRGSKTKDFKVTADMLK